MFIYLLMCYITGNNDCPTWSIIVRVLIFSTNNLEWGMAPTTVAVEGRVKQVEAVVLVAILLK